MIYELHISLLIFILSFQLYSRNILMSKLRIFSKSKGIFGKSCFFNPLDHAAEQVQSIWRLEIVLRQYCSHNIALRTSSFVCITQTASSESIISVIDYFLDISNVSNPSDQWRVLQTRLICSAVDALVQVAALKSKRLRIQDTL